MVLQGCKSTPRKADQLNLAMGDTAVQVANVCSYKLGQKSEFQFELGRFFHAQSHMYSQNSNTYQDLLVIQTSLSPYT